MLEIKVSSIMKYNKNFNILSIDWHLSNYACKYAQYQEKVLTKNTLCIRQEIRHTPSYFYSYI